MQNLCKAVAMLAVLAMPFTAFGAPAPIWQTTLDDDASTTVGGGTIVNPPSTYVSGAIGNAFAGNGSVYARWQNTQVGTIFAAWNDSLGFTVDLYFYGSNWSTQSGDSGFWSIARRNGGTDDRYIIASVRNGKLRLLFSGSGPDVTQYKYTLDGGLTPGETAPAVPLQDDVVYRLTMRQANGAFDVYVGGGAYGTLASPQLVFSATNLPAGYTWTMVPSGGSVNAREMDVARRAAFTGALQTGQWVDNIRVFNGFFSPADLETGGPPVAAISADTTSGFVPLTVNFDGSASYDTDPTNIITQYEWDFDNNGTVDATGATTSHTYTTGATYQAKLTVTDNENQTASSVLTITAYSLPASGLLTITAMEPSGTLAAGSYPLTSVTTQRIGSVPTYTASELVGPPDIAHVEVTGTGITGGGAGATTPAEAMVGLELGSTVAGLNADGKFLAGYFPDDVVVRPDGTNAPEIFVIESSNSSDSFQIQLLTNGPGSAIEIATTVQVRSIDYESTSTVIGGTGRGGVGVDLDALGVAAVRGVRLTGADGFGGGSGVDPVLIAGVPIRCNTPAVDVNGDGEVDLEDFAKFQRCFTGSGDPSGAFDFEACYCFDRDRDRDVDEFDLNEFTDCATGPAIPWSPALAPDCIP